jgi:hypothetical protein
MAGIFLPFLSYTLQCIIRRVSILINMGVLYAIPEFVVLGFCVVQVIMVMEVNKHVFI